MARLSIGSNLMKCFFTRMPVLQNSVRPLGPESIAVRCVSGREKARDRRDLLRGVPKMTEGVTGEKKTPSDESTPQEYQGCYRLPDENTPNELFDGVPFKNIHMIYVRCSKNNTKYILVDPKKNAGSMIRRSCGMEGFKNCRKGTTVAAYATGLSMANRMKKMTGQTLARLIIRGLGPGRMECIKGLMAGGVKIVSITDDTRYYDHPCRPPAAKSI